MNWAVHALGIPGPCPHVMILLKDAAFVKREERLEQDCENKPQESFPLPLHILFLH